MKQILGIFLRIVAVIVILMRFASMTGQTPQQLFLKLNTTDFIIAFLMLIMFILGEILSFKKEPMTDNDKHIFSMLNEAFSKIKIPLDIMQQNEPISFSQVHLIYYGGNIINSHDAYFNNSKMQEKLKKLKNQINEYFNFLNTNTDNYRKLLTQTGNDVNAPSIIGLHKEFIKQRDELKSSMRDLRSLGQKLGLSIE